MDTTCIPATCIRCKRGISATGQFIRRSPTTAVASTDASSVATTVSRTINVADDLVVVCATCGWCVVGAEVVDGGSTATELHSFVWQNVSWQSGFDPSTCSFSQAHESLQPRYHTSASIDTCIATPRQPCHFELLRRNNAPNLAIENGWLTYIQNKARFPVPELTTRVNGPSTRLVETRTRQHGPCWRVMETGHPSTRAVNSGSENWA